MGGNRHRARTVAAAQAARKGKAEEVGGCSVAAWRVRPLRPAGTLGDAQLAAGSADSQAQEPYTVWTCAETLRACSSVRMSPGSLVKTRSACAVIRATCASTT